MNLKLLILLIALGSCGNPQKTTTLNTNNSTQIQKDGLVKEYFSDGQLKSECHYKAGVREGHCKEWWPNGKLSTDGLANGSMKWYSELGHLAAVGNMINGKRNGLWKVCDWQDSTFCTTGHFRDEEEFGKWTSFHSNGLVERENNWKAGKLISETCWDEEGRLIECE